MTYNYNLQSFKDATPVNTFVKMALAGPQNSGKTVSALRIASGLGGETCIIDSENKRSLKYAGDFKFKHLSLDPPFSSENYEAAIAAAVKAGFNNVIVDSMSHEHEGPGGMLEQVENYLNKKTADIDDERQRDKKREALKMSAFIGPKAARNRLIQFGIQRVNANVLLCFRAKNKMAMKKEKWHNDQTGKSGEKTVVADAGLQPIGGEEFWYEMDIVAMMQEGARGKPSWDEQASRINDMKGDLTKYLHGVQQFDESVGRRLKEFNTPVAGFVLKTSRAEAAYPTPAEWFSKALDIVGKLTTADHFKSFLSLNGLPLQSIKDASEETYESFMAAFMARQEELKNQAAKPPEETPSRLV